MSLYFSPNVDANGNVFVVTPPGSSLVVDGNVASGAADVGNPIKMGGVYRSTLPTLTNGQRGDAQMASNGMLFSAIGGTDIASPAHVYNYSTDAIGTKVGLVTYSNGLVWNGTSWDRMRGNTVAQSVLPGLTTTFWNYAAAGSGIVNTTTAVTVKAAAGTLGRNFISGISLSWDSLTNATEFCIRNGAGGTVMFRYKIVDGSAGRDNIQFPVPLRGSPNSLVEIVTLTASGAGGVFANLQGFTDA